MNDLFNYDTSWLNPGLKVLSVVLFIVVAYGYIRARRMYAGDLLRFFSIAVLMGIVGAVAAVVRYYDHGLMFGFTKELSLKWFQSLGAVAQAIIFVVAVRQIAKGIVPDIRDEAHGRPVSSVEAGRPQAQGEAHP
jgi:hypothetical protein